MPLRPIALRDLEGVSRLGAKMHAESVYSRFDYDENKFIKLLCRFIMNTEDHFTCIGEINGEPVGVFLGSIGEHYFGKDKIASDTLWYVLPKHRGSIMGVRMLRAFETWARDRNVADITVGVSSGLNLNKTNNVLEKSGYEVVGGIYKRRAVE